MTPAPTHSIEPAPTPTAAREIAADSPVGAIAACSAPPPQKIFVVGHRNPDADAICSAIAYAAYKEARGELGYVAARCGNTNARIDTILSRFRQSLPHYLSDVSPRVHDSMTAGVVALPETATCAEALDLIDRHRIRVLPVVDATGAPVGTVSQGDLAGVFIPRVSAPRLMRQVHTSLESIARALKGRAIHLVGGSKVEDFFVRLGTMDVRSFWSISEREQIPASQSIIIVGDRSDIHRRAIEIGIRALVITSGIGIDPDVVDLARERGVSIIISPYDSATSAWVVRTGSSIERVIARDFETIDPDERIADVRKRFSVKTHALLVTNDDERLVGILTKSDIFKPVQTRLVLVDHNELTQAVPGAGEVVITEIIDHHRLGALHTAQPILFINEPVGSTCTIIADLFRRENLRPSPEIAGIMMSGLIADTLHLNGPTTTSKDAQILAWLSQVAQVNAKQLADEIFNSGSVILASPPEKVVRSDFKIYDEEGIRYAVSQVEELGFGNFWQHAKALAQAVQQLREEEQLAFAALLVTDINTQNSLLLVKGDSGIISAIGYPHVQQDEIFDMPGVVSRKKQLIPYLTSLIKELAAEGTLPTGSRPPIATKKKRRRNGGSPTPADQM